MGRTPEDAWADAMRVAARLAEATQELVRWEWDSHLSAVLGVVDAPREQALLELIGGLFLGVWDQRTIAQAPSAVRALASAWGGLRAGQRLFTLDPVDDPLLFAAWWPWGGGKTFSLRLSCAARSAPAEDLDPLTQLRRCFAV